MNFEELTKEQQIAIHEVEIKALKGLVDRHEQILMATLHMLANVAQVAAPASAAKATELRELLSAQKNEIRSRSGFWDR